MQPIRGCDRCNLYNLILLLLISTTCLITCTYYHNNYIDYDYYAKLAVSGIIIALFSTINVITCHTIQKMVEHLTTNDKRVVDTIIEVYLVITFIVTGFMIKIEVILVSIIFLCIELVLFTCYIWYTKSRDRLQEIDNGEPLLYEL